MLDGDGAYMHYPYGGGLSNQPAFDMHVYDEIRHIWVERKNAEIKSG